MAGSKGRFRWPEIRQYLKQPLVYHGLFWLVYFLINVARWGNYHQDYYYALQANLIEFPLHIILAYLNIYYLIPKLLPKRYLLYILSMGLGVAVVVSIRLLLENWFQVYPAAPPMVGIRYIWELLIGEIYVQGFVTAFKLLLDWGKTQKRTRELEKHNFETELDFLKSQIQPHFFFNTLNNLYSLTLDKSDLAPETVLKLSELMSYVIYEGKQKSVHLTKEVKYIQNYIDLERLRYQNRLQVEFNILGDIKNQQIAPMLLLPFIENSFKHGAGKNMKKVPIQIELQVEDHSLTFSVKNRKSDHLEVHHQDPYHHAGHNGVGVDNIKRRLKLIYGEHYQLQMDNELHHYSVTLTIPTYEN